MLGIGSVVALPVVPWVNDRYGRKLSIVLGSLIVVVGVVIQTAAVNRTYAPLRGFIYLA